MSAHGMIDLAIAAVVALLAVLGWRRGLFRSLAELAAMVLALVIAALLYVPLKKYMLAQDLPQ